MQETLPFKQQSKEGHALNVKEELIPQPIMMEEAHGWKEVNNLIREFLRICCPFIWLLVQIEQFVQWVS